MPLTRTLAQLRSSVQARWQLDNSPDLGSSANSLGIIALNEMINDALIELNDLLIQKWQEYRTQGPISFSTIIGTDTYSFDSLISSGPTGINDFYKLRKFEINVGGRWRRMTPIDLDAAHLMTSPGGVYRRYRYRLQLAPFGVLSLVIVPTPTTVESMRFWYVQQADELVADSDATIFHVPIEEKLLLALVGRDVLDRQDLDPSPAISRIEKLTSQLNQAADALDVGEPFYLSPVGPGYPYDDDDWPWGVR